MDSKFWITILLLTSFFKRYEANVELPTVTVRGFLNFKTTVDGTVIVFTPVSEITVAVKPATTSSASFPASVEAHEGVVQKNDFVKEKRIQDLSFAPQNFLSPPVSSGDSEMKESDMSENAVLLSSHQGDKIKKIAATGLESTSGISKELTTNTLKSPRIASSKNTEPLGTASDVLHTSKWISNIKSELMSVSSLVAVKSLLSSSPIDATKAIKTPILKNTEQQSLISNVSPISSKQINSKVNSDFETEPRISSSVVIDSLLSSRLIDTTKTTKTLFSKSTEPQVLLSDISPIHSKQISSTLNSDAPMEPISSSVVIDSLRPSSTVEIFIPNTPTITSTKQITEFQVSSSVTRQMTEIQVSSSVESKSVSHILNPSPSFQSNSIEDTQSHILQSSFSSVTDSDAQKSTESLETLLLTTEYSSTHGDDPKKNSSRTRFLSLRRPSQSVKLNRFKVKLTLRQDSLEENGSTDEDEDLELITEPNSIDPAKVVFKETTITSEVTLHVGRRKSVRLLTITTSVPMTVNPTDILNTDEEESHHNVETRTFTTTERVLKTSIVPVYDGKSTAYHRVTESFFIMKFITAYKTLPTGEATMLEEAAQEVTAQSSALPPLQNQFLSFGHALTNNPLAAVYLGLQQLNAQMTMFSTVTETSTYVTTETFYDTKTVRFYDGKSNRFRTVSEPTSTKMQTIITTITSVRPYINTQAMQQQQKLQQFIAPTQLESQFETKTSIYTTKTISTSLSTRVYTLIYNGFSTKFRTITSTTTFPTVITVTSTTKVPVTPTQFMYPYSS